MGIPILWEVAFEIGVWGGRRKGRFPQKLHNKIMLRTTTRRRRRMTRTGNVLKEFDNSVKDLKVERT